MRTQKEDIALGEQNELSVKESVEKLVGEEMVRQGGFNIMDFSNKSKTIYAELKSRTIPSTRFSSAIIGKNKIDFCNDPTKTYYFLFKYVDGLFYIKYDPKLFSTFRVKSDFVRSDRADCVSRPSEVVEIPRSLLVKI